MSDNPMLSPQITKMTINIGVGEGGDRLSLAERVLNLLTGCKPVRTLAKTTNRELKQRHGFPVGCKVTLRDKEQIEALLKDAFWIREKSIPKYCFDRQGNLSFGINDYTDFPGLKYDPDIGIFGMDINVVLERPGHRVSRRRVRSRKIPSKHGVTQEESQVYFSEKFELNITEG